MIRRWLQRFLSRLTAAVKGWGSHRDAKGDERAATDEHLAELERQLLDIDRFASRIVSPLVDTTDEQRIALGLCVSIREVYRGICVLLREGLAEEARMLWRTLLDDAALLMWMVTHQDDLEEIALRFYYTEATRAEGIARAARDAGFDWAAEVEANRHAELEAVIAEAAKRGLQLRQLPNTRQLLEDLRQHGRLYYQHVRASQGIHSTAIGLSARFRQPTSPEETVGIHLESDPDIIVQMGVLAAEIFLRGLAAAAHILGWDEDSVHREREAQSPRLRSLYFSVAGQADQDDEPGQA